MWWPGQSESEPDHDRQRNRMVDDLARWIDRDATEQAMRAVPRHAFVPADHRHRSYVDRPIPIGQQQTISAPHMVAKMLDVLAPSPGDRVLEIGTGCGYHAAVTAEVVGADRVYSVEYHPELAARATRNLERTGYGAVSVRIGDGATGWAAHAPYDAIYATCATPDLPPALIDQARVGAPILVPLGEHRHRLVRARKRTDGTVERTDHGGVRFVPMVRDD